jgi:DNA replication ATP-dependent helicase Dna2
VLRIGDPAKVDLGLHGFLKRGLSPRPRLVACTLACAHSSLLEELGLATFDHVVVDEAGRSTLSSTLPVLLRSRESWALSGDPEQLCPIVPDGGNFGEAGGSVLRYYLGIPGVREQRTHVLSLSYRFESYPIAKGTQAFYGARGVSLDCSLADLREPGALVFIDTGEQPAAWAKYGKSMSLANTWEAAAVRTAAEGIARESGGLDGALLILTCFRLQVELIRRLFRPRHRGLVLSIDRAQGSERPIIIVSLVADTPERLLRYLRPEKLNVAWSRARKRLLLVGNFKALASACDQPGCDPGTRALLDAVLEHGRIEEIKPDPRALERAAQKLKALTEVWRHAPERERCEAPGYGSVLKELHRIPLVDRRLLLGVRRGPMRRR